MRAREVDDTTGNIHLPAGTYNVKGQRALDYVRVRHDIGTAENGDIGRMKRQQTFLAGMANKVVSAGTLANPVRLVQVPRRRHEVADHRLRTSASIRSSPGLAKSLKGIGLDHIQFLTVPFEAYAPDPNRLEWAPGAKKLWTRIRMDKPVGKGSPVEVTTARDQERQAREEEGPSAVAGTERDAVPGRQRRRPPRTASAPDPRPLRSRPLRRSSLAGFASCPSRPAPPDGRHERESSWSSRRRTVLGGLDRQRSRRRVSSGAVAPRAAAAAWLPPRSTWWWSEAASPAWSRPATYAVPAHSVLVLEARDRVGGRVLNHELSDGS